jgi:serine protease Do
MKKGEVNVMDFNGGPKYENSSNTENTTDNTNEKTYTYENGTFYQNDDYSRYEKMNGSEKQRSSRKGNFRGILGTVAAGVVGSALTLAVLPHTDYFKSIANENNGTAIQQTTTDNAVKTVSAKPSAANGTGSIADTVDRISKTIVGIVNYQQQNNNANNLFGNGNFGSSGGFGNSGNDGSTGNGNSNTVETGSGSGVIFQKNGDSAYIVTNNHVVEGASKLEVSLYSGQKTTATVVGTDALTDLAVLKIDSKYVTSTAEFGDSSVLRPGDEVLAIGNPLGLDLSRTVTQGIVSATNRSIAVSTSAGDWETNVIQTDAAINPGNSGGALINTQGQVVGINSLKISETGVEGLGFAIPSNDLIPIVNQLIKNGKVERPYLGVGLADLSEVPQMYWNNLPNDVQKGVMITNIDPQSVAANSGLKQRDVIVSMNGTDINSSADLRKYLYTKVKIGDTVKFGLYRNGKLMKIDVKLSAKAAN